MEMTGWLAGAALGMAAGGGAVWVWLSRVVAVKDSQLASARESALEQKNYFEELRKTNKIEFENLANAILEAKSKTFTEQNQTSLKTLLDPLDKRIREFHEKVDHVYDKESKERFALGREVSKMMELNQQMSLEAQNLARALKGENKIQGDWGEMVLERILESSGLREGVEYELQKEHQGEDGSRYRPDVVVKLPDNKHLVVDAKVSLKAYEMYCATEDPDERIRLLASHVDSVSAHVNELSKKHYTRLKGLKTPDFVFMFMPIEPAYMLAMQADHALSARAWEKNVAIVTSTTLFTTLRAVAHTWRLDSQNRNAQEIAQEGGRMYDKFAGFLEDFADIREHLFKGLTAHDKAMGKLKTGRGSVFTKMEKLRELGATPTKKIDSDPGE